MSRFSFSPCLLQSQHFGNGLHLVPNCLLQQIYASLEVPFSISLGANTPTLASSASLAARIFGKIFLQNDKYKLNNTRGIMKFSVLFDIANRTQ